MPISFHKNYLISEKFCKKDEKSLDKGRGARYTVKARVRMRMGAVCDEAGDCSVKPR